MRSLVVEIMIMKYGIIIFHLNIEISTKNAPNFWRKKLKPNNSASRCIKRRQQQKYGNGKFMEFSEMKSKRKFEIRFQKPDTWSNNLLPFTASNRLLTVESLTLNLKIFLNWCRKFRYVFSLFFCSLRFLKNEFHFLSFPCPLNNFCSNLSTWKRF